MVLFSFLFSFLYRSQSLAAGGAGGRRDVVRVDRDVVLNKEQLADEQREGAGEGVNADAVVQERAPRVQRARYHQIPVSRRLELHCSSSNE